MLFVLYTLKVLATVGLFARHRGLLTWQFCQFDNGKFCSKQNTGKTFWFDTLDELRDSYRLLTSKYRYAQCCLLPE